MIQHRIERKSLPRRNSIEWNLINKWISLSSTESNVSFQQKQITKQDSSACNSSETHSCPREEFILALPAHWIVFRVFHWLSQVLKLVCLCACLIEIDYTETTLGIAIFFVFSFSALSPSENLFCSVSCGKINEMFVIPGLCLFRKSEILIAARLSMCWWDLLEAFFCCYSLRHHKTPCLRVAASSC